MSLFLSVISTVRGLVLRTYIWFEILSACSLCSQKTRISLTLGQQCASWTAFLSPGIQINGLDFQRQMVPTTSAITNAHAQALLQQVTHTRPSFFLDDGDITSYFERKHQGCLQNCVSLHTHRTLGRVQLNDSGSPFVAWQQGRLINPVCLLAVPWLLGNRWPIICKSMQNLHVVHNSYFN